MCMIILNFCLISIYAPFFSLESPSCPIYISFSVA